MEAPSPRSSSNYQTRKMQRPGESKDTQHHVADKQYCIPYCGGGLLPHHRWQLECKDTAVQERRAKQPTKHTVDAKKYALRDTIFYRATLKDA